MLRLPKIGVLLFFCLLGAASAADNFQPKPFPVPDLPVNTGEYWAATMTPDGWVIAATNGVVRQTNGRWSMERPPTGGRVQLALPYRGGFVVAGRGFCYVWTAGDWQPTDINDNIRSGAVADGVVLLAGRKAIYALEPGPRVRTVLTFETDTTAYFHQRGGQTLLFVHNQAYVWDGKNLVSGSADFVWKNQPPTYCDEDSNGVFFAGSPDALIQYSKQGQPTLFLEKDRWRTFVTERICGIAILEDTVVIATLNGGVTAFARDTKEERWHIGKEHLDGAVTMLAAHADGLLIGTLRRLFNLPSPSRGRYTKIPEGAFVFSFPLPQGLVLGFESGLTLLDGTPVALPSASTGIPSFLLKLPSGILVQAKRAQLVWGDRVIPLPDRPSKRIYTMVQVRSGKVALTRDSGITIVAPDGELHELPQVSVTTSIVATSAGGLLAGTPNGVISLSEQGVEQERFGYGHSMTFVHEGQAMVIDVRGNWFDEKGRIVGLLPPMRVISTTFWHGRVCVLAQFANGNIEAGLADPRKGTWQPLDLPMPTTPKKVTVDGEKLLVIGHSEIMTVTQVPDQSAPSPNFLWRKNNRAWTPDQPLATDEDTVDLVLPPPRLAPWESPHYKIRVGNGGWQEAVPGAHVPISRLAWDRTEVTVRAERAGRETQATYALVRLRPWWARWPGFVLAGSALSLAGYGTLRWRTSRLQRRNRELEQIVATRTAELRQAQRAREEFFSTLSHELRNPLNGVVGLCEMLAEAPADAVAPRERLFVRTLRGCAEQLRSMLDDVLDFARIDRGEIELRLTDFELGPTVEGAARAVDVALAHCHLELPPTTHWLCGDSGKLRQIVTNLVSNALKHGVPPGARLTARLTPSPAAPFVHTLDLVVASTGPTLPDTELARIFHGFSRGTEALRRHLPGSGLGLAVSHRLAEAMGGQLTATSHDGLTEFRLQLPFVPSRAETVSPSPTPFATTEIPPARGLVLAIEDEPYNRLVLGHQLASLGYAVDWAEDGATARRHAQSRHYDLILTDYLLPDATGVELAREFLATLPAPRPPILAITAYATAEKIAEARAAGIAAVLTKPVSRDQLAAALGGFAPPTSASSFASATDAVAHDFSPLLRLPDGRRTLAEYAAHLPLAWTALLGRLAESACSLRLRGHRNTLAVAHPDRVPGSATGRVCFVHKENPQRDRCQAKGLRARHLQGPK